MCLFHKWNGCKCEKCGKTRHKWKSYNDVSSWGTHDDVICKRCGIIEFDIYGIKTSETKTETNDVPQFYIKNDSELTTADLVLKYVESKTHEASEYWETNDDYNYSSNVMESFYTEYIGIENPVAYLSDSELNKLYNYIKNGHIGEYENFSLSSVIDREIERRTL